MWRLIGKQFYLFFIPVSVSTLREVSFLKLLYQKVLPNFFSLLFLSLWIIAIQGRCDQKVCEAICLIHLTSNDLTKFHLAFRKSELVGYQDALASIGRSSTSLVESLMWVNTIMAT